MNKITYPEGSHVEVSFGNSPLGPVCNASFLDANDNELCFHRSQFLSQALIMLGDEIEGKYE